MSDMMFWSLVAVAVVGGFGVAGYLIGGWLERVTDRYYPLADEDDPIFQELRKRPRRIP